MKSFISQNKPLNLMYNNNLSEVMSLREKQINKQKVQKRNMIDQSTNTHISTNDFTLEEINFLQANSQNESEQFIALKPKNSAKSYALNEELPKQTNITEMLNEKVFNAHLKEDQPQLIKNYKQLLPNNIKRKIYVYQQPIIQRMEKNQDFLIKKQRNYEINQQQQAITLGLQKNISILFNKHQQVSKYLKNVSQSRFLCLKNKFINSKALENIKSISALQQLDIKNWETQQQPFSLKNAASKEDQDLQQLQKRKSKLQQKRKVFEIENLKDFSKQRSLSVFHELISQKIQKEIEQNEEMKNYENYVQSMKNEKDINNKWFIPSNERFKKRYKVVPLEKLPIKYNDTFIAENLFNQHAFQMTKQNKELFNKNEENIKKANQIRMFQKYLKFLEGKDKKKPQFLKNYKVPTILNIKQFKEKYLQMN